MLPKINPWTTYQLLVMKADSATSVKQVAVLDARIVSYNVSSGMTFLSGSVKDLLILTADDCM